MAATLDGVPFDLDPTSVRWEYDIHINDSPFVGGKVVQVFGASISDITVEGTFGRGTWEAQLAMLERMKQLSRRGSDAANFVPYRFTWPEQGWDFQVLVREFVNPEGSRSVVHRNTIIAPKWRLILYPVQGSGALKEAAVTHYLDRLRDGLGWQLTSYNGAVSISEAQAAIVRVGASSLEEFAQIAFGGGAILPQNDAYIAGPSVTGQNFGSGVIGVDAMLNLARNAGWTGQNIVIAVAIAKGESGWDPSAHNPDRSTGDDSYGLWQINRLAHFDRFGSGAELKIPERNAAAAYALWRGRGGNFLDWSVYKNGTYRRYLPEVEAAAQRLGIG